MNAIPTHILDAIRSLESSNDRMTIENASIVILRAIDRAEVSAPDLEDEIEGAIARLTTLIGMGHALPCCLDLAKQYDRIAMRYAYPRPEGRRNSYVNRATA